MARDKAKDDKYFNCGQEHEYDYVSGLYEDKEEVKEFLKENCDNGTINYFTHMEVYQLIEEKLGYPIPV